jgi:3-hydroxybutyryl-CoA dehydrogenase
MNAATQTPEIQQNGHAAPKRAVLVVGAGIMGAGIAQVVAQAGHKVWLYDMREGAAQSALQNLQTRLGALVAKGKMTAEQVDALIGRIVPVASLQDAASSTLVVEAIVEQAQAKRALWQQLEDLVGTDCVFASNTSSISITAMAQGLRHPERLVGMHFFNPVAQMKLVEVVSGLHTAPQIAADIFALAQSWGKVAVHARSTPGFIVNRIARPYYAEALALLQEQCTSPVVLDACLKAIGFRMGPCELMDLIGHDTNFAVTESVYQANFFDKRYMPSLYQRELVDGGLLGRKTGRGIYDYAEGATQAAVAATVTAGFPARSDVQLHGSGARMDAWAARLTDAGLVFSREHNSSWKGLSTPSLQLRETDGRTASSLGANVAVFDLAFEPAGSRILAWAPSVRASSACTAEARDWLSALGYQPQQVADQCGLIVARTVAMLINEAADAVQQGVCSVDGANQAMKLGVNYPAGPFDWLAAWSAQGVLDVLAALDAQYRGERYRVSPWLRQQACAALGSV